MGERRLSAGTAGTVLNSARTKPPGQQGTYKLSARYLITGCSGGGKSTLVDHFGALGHHIVPEPGRRVIRAAQDDGRDALPWVNESAFEDACEAMAHQDLERVSGLAGPVFFDRGLLEVAVARHDRDGTPLQATLGDEWPYAEVVFLAPPWPELYVNDGDRRHGLEDGIAEYERITIALDQLGLKAISLPRIPVAARADFVLRSIAPSGQ